MACLSKHKGKQHGRPRRQGSNSFVGGVILGRGVVEAGCLQTTDITPPEV